MSDSYRRYHAVKQKMCQLLPDQWAACPSRLINLSLMISAIPKAWALTQHALAAEMPVVAQDTSLAQRQRRWLMNEAVSHAQYYEPIIKPVLQTLAGATVPLILDTTPMGGNCHMLSVAVGYQRRALPVTWQAGPGKRGHTLGQSQIELLDQVSSYLAPASEVVVLGDGEFGHIQLLTWLQAQGWHYCLRVAKDCQVYYEGQWRRLDSFDLQPDETIWLEQVWFTQTEPVGPVNVRLSWDQARDCLLPLVTNFELPQETAYWYDKRYWIEPLFGDLKGHGFNLQSCRLRHPDRLDRLMIALALAYLWLCYLGVQALLSGQSRWVDRSDARQRSIFTIGRQWLNRLLKLDRTILVAFSPFPLIGTLPKVGVG